MSTIEDKECLKCGLFKTCYSPKIPMEEGTPERPRVLVIGEAPGGVEDTLGKPFVGDSGKLLREALNMITPEGKRFWITNSVKCRPPMNKLKGVTPVRCCWRFTQEDIQTADPDVIICCGATAYKQIVGSGSITSVRGRVYDVEVCGRMRKVAPIFHPAYILRNIGAMKIWEEDILRLKPLVTGKQTTALAKYELVGEKEFVEVAKRVGWFVYDIETNRELDFTLEGGFITVISVSTIENGKAYCCSISLPDKDNMKYLCENLFSDPKLTIVGHNIKFDLVWTLSKLGIFVDNKIFDTQIAYSVLVDEEANSSLKTLAYIYTPYGGYEQKMKALDNNIPTGYSRAYYDELLSQEYKDTLAEYNRYDTVVTGHIYLKMLEILEEADPELYKLVYGVFFKISKLITKMEVSGVKIDTWLLGDYEKTVNERLKDYTVRLKTTVAKFGNRYRTGITPEYVSKLNVDSYSQMSDLFYNKLNLPVLVTTETNAPSVNEQAISELLREVSSEDVIYQVLHYFSAIKSLNTINNLFIEKFKEKLRGEYIYPRYSIVKIDRAEFKGAEAGGTVTSRLSSANPNLQQIPASFLYGGGGIDNIKAEALNYINLQALVCSRFKDGMIMVADFSQIELRMATILSSDESMLYAYRNNVDLHTYTASQVFEVDMDKVDKAQRNKAKTVNFGVIYGQSASAFAKTWGVSLEEAKAFITKYFSLRSGLKRFIDDTREEVMRNGYVKDLFGKVRRLGNVWSEEKYVVEEAIRQAVNFKCQSSASILTLISLLRIDSKFEALELKSKIIGTVHDSILVDCAPDEIDTVQKIVLSSMTKWDKYNFPIPIEADVKIATRWGFAK